MPIRAPSSTWWTASDRPWWRSPFAAGKPNGQQANDQKGRERGGAGSGVIVAPDGLILTNSHVAGAVGGSAARIDVTTPDGQDLRARLVGDDPDTDLALLRVDEAVTLPSAQLGDSERLKRGQLVIAIGNPLGFESTVTAGVVSRARPLPAFAQRPHDRRRDPDRRRAQSRQFRRAAVSSHGEVIGINTAVIMGAQGICFAVAANTAHFVLGELVRHGHVRRAFIGIAAQQIVLPPRLRRAAGLDQERAVMAGTVEPDGAAARAGLRGGDIIVALDGAIRTDEVDDIGRLGRGGAIPSRSSRDCAGSPGRAAAIPRGRLAR